MDDGQHGRPVRVLAVDGGGIRGIIPAMLLAEVERRTQRPACELFDLIAGTSTGAIIALGLVLAGPDGRPAFAAADGVSVYTEHGPRIFERSGRDLLASLGGLTDARYRPDGLVAILDSTFGTARLTDALTDVLVPAYEISRRETFMFSSRKARTDADRDFLMRDAVRAATAAPTFFPPVRLVSPAGVEHVLVDGAVFANSPAVCAYAETIRHEPGRPLVLASVGAGSLTRRFTWDEARGWGVAEWARPLLEIVLDASAQAGDFALREALGPNSYFRFQQELGRASDALDDVSPENLRALQDEGRDLIARSSADIDRLCEALLA